MQPSAPQKEDRALIAEEEQRSDQQKAPYEAALSKTEV